MNSAITIRDVTKRFGDFTAVDDVSLTVEEGEIFGFLGPNGAGKSTTINMILGFSHPTDGEIDVLGYDAQRESKQMRKDIGVLPEGYSVYNRLTGRKHLEFEIGSKNADDDPDEILDRVGLDPDDADRKAGGYSKGMAQRLVLGMALVGDPDLLILDEPSSGLDPNGVREMREIVLEENKRGTTVFFSSHILGQVEAVCDRVGILDSGRIAAQDSIDGLRQQIETESTITMTVSGSLNGTEEAVAGLPGVDRVTSDENVLTVTCRDEAMSQAVAEVHNAGVSIEKLRTDDASLEDLFVRYTSGETAPETVTA